jgi:sterol desaturase/sphingolipid hydroxylase (fatty acid hydroxylase superfamily)
MTPDAFASSLVTIGGILAAMAGVAALEVWIPLRARTRANAEHLAPNLALTFLTFATNFVLSAVVLAMLAFLRARGFGLLDALRLPPLAAGAVAVVLLDLSFYAAHVAMHRIPSWWRVHSVHHSDPAVDVTTTIRQHPAETAIRYAFITALAAVLVPSPAAFAFYRAAAAGNGLLEHANLRLPDRLDRALALVTTWPNLHKIHHARDAARTDTNFGNLLSVWDRLFGTFTPSREAAGVVYGLDAYDDPALRTTAGLLAAPWRVGRARIARRTRLAAS